MFRVRPVAMEVDPVLGALVDDHPGVGDRAEFHGDGAPRRGVEQPA
jgi:hypothetical protein